MIVKTDALPVLSCGGPAVVAYRLNAFGDALLVKRATFVSWMSMPDDSHLCLCMRVCRAGCTNR